MTGDRERDVLLAVLAGSRSHVLEGLVGLQDSDLRRAVLPSGWSPIELVHHLTIDVERWWFRKVAAGEDISFADHPRSGWFVADDVAPGAVLEEYRQECVLSDDVISAKSLDDVPAWCPEDVFRDWRPRDLRAVVLHTITETTRHVGQLDAVREMIDGHQWLVLDA